MAVTHQPTETGLSIIDSIKRRYFPNGYQSKPRSGGVDYRFTPKGQAEYRRGFKLSMARLVSQGGEA
ncbi:hypothetical protein HGP28_10640 [Vibrio sp. SM6]|uniref:Uncharacterized protein n=1 Tax=Vibrio agarilyticus TaxID=2726741 RepID=A0A7X8TRB3_9VIBR|nr:hypothetical protein [Vibrio agarilyticus]NLS13349.1 hypothetical protein [Vibrio agarilyticus]